MTEEVKEITLSIHTGARMAPIISPVLQNIGQEENAAPEEVLIAMLGLAISGLCELTKDNEMVQDLVTGISADIFHMLEEMETEH